MALLSPYRNKVLTHGKWPYLESTDETGLEFHIQILQKGESLDSFYEGRESALLVIEGQGFIQLENKELEFSRPNWIDSPPWVLHTPDQSSGTILAKSGCKIAVVRTKNKLLFEPKIYEPSQIDVEHRGQGLLDDTCYRHVRLAFDRTVAHENSRLVLGEVLNYPGKWSSYPPHHHPQPEIYYYEFNPPEGYGHGELGEDVYKIKHQDLLKITHNRDHSQVAAPGYHLYYLWAIRHLDHQPYDGFEFTKPYDKLLKSN